MQSEGERIGVPQFSDDPVSAIGFVLQEFGAGLGGRELPSTKLRRETLESKRLELAQLQVGSQALEQGIRLLERTPEEGRAGVIDEFSANFEEVMPGLRGTLTEMSADIPTSKQILGALGEFAPELQSFCGSDIECIRQHATDSTFMEGLQKTRDRTNMPIVGAKLRDITGAMFSNPEALSGIPRDEMDDFVMSMGDLERANESFPEEMKLTPSELRTIERNPQILMRYGIKTPEMQEFEIKEGFKSRLRLQEAAFKDRLEGGKATKSDLIDESGNVKSEVSNDIQKRVAFMFGLQADPNTGNFTSDFTPDMARKVNDATVTAGALLQQGRASDVSQAVAMATAGMVPETVDPELAVPTATREQMTAQNAEIARAIPMIEETLDAAAGGTGALSNLAAMTDATIGQFTSDTLFPDKQDARQRIKTMNNELRRALANNPRFSEGEQQRISSLLPNPDDWLQNPATAGRQMKQLLSHLRGIEARNSEILGGKKPETQAETGGLDFGREDVEATAQAEGMTVDQVIESVRKSRGLTQSADEIKKALGL